ncbi:transposase-like protein [Salinibacter ruber]|nr:transposase-like protein [Salinibacter ruber]MCS4198542.1 transposase-like protein [Salinibacter ruber]
MVLDAMQLKVRRQKAVWSTTAMIAVGISEDGQREILGFKIALRETGESWKELFEDLKARRGLRRVELATSDAHEGLEAALRSAFPGCIWQRCRAHFRRNVLDKTPAGYRDRMHELLDQILEADSQQKA